jgi:hypothetical protein
MPSAPSVRSLPTLAIVLAGIAAFTVGLSAVFWKAPASEAQAQEICAQPSQTGCPMQLDIPVAAALNDPATTHNWLLNVITQNDLRIVLTNLPADYQLWVYGPGDSLLALSNNPGTQDEVVNVGFIGIGFYWIVIDSPSGESSELPYTLNATPVAFADPATAVATPSGLDPYGTPVPRVILPY